MSKEVNYQRLEKNNHNVDCGYMAMEKLSLLVLTAYPDELHIAVSSSTYLDSPMQPHLLFHNFTVHHLLPPRAPILNTMPVLTGFEILLLTALIPYVFYTHKTSIKFVYQQELYVGPFEAELQWFLNALQAKHENKSLLGRSECIGGSIHFSEEDLFWKDSFLYQI